MKTHHRGRPGLALRIADAISVQLVHGGQVLRLLRLFLFLWLLLCFGRLFQLLLLLLCLWLRLLLLLLLMLLHWLILLKLLFHWLFLLRLLLHRLSLFRLLLHWLLLFWLLLFRLLRRLAAVLYLPFCPLICLLLRQRLVLFHRGVLGGFRHAGCIDGLRDHLLLLKPRRLSLLHQVDALTSVIALQCTKQKHKVIHFMKNSMVCVIACCCSCSLCLLY